MADPLNVLLVQSHPLYGECVRRQLADHGGFESIVLVRQIRDVLDSADRSADHVAVIDSRLPGEGALELTRVLRGRASELPILVFDVGSDREILAFAEAGASGCVPCDATVQELAERIRRVAGGEVSYPQRVTRHLVTRLSELANGNVPPAARCQVLTPRELEVLELVAQGLANKEIASRLGISLNTIKNHVHNIIEKLGTGGRWAAVAHAHREGWISFSPRRRRYPAAPQPVAA